MHEWGASMRITLFRVAVRLFMSVGLPLFSVQIAVAAGPASAISVSANGPQWGSSGFAVSQTGSLTAEVDGIPSASNIDGGIGLSNGPQTAHWTCLHCPF